MRTGGLILIATLLGCAPSTSWRYVAPTAARAIEVTPPSMTVEEPPLATIDRAGMTLTIDDAPATMTVQATSERHGPVISTTLRGTLPPVAADARASVTVSLPAGAALHRLAPDDRNPLTIIEGGRFDGRGGSASRVGWWFLTSGAVPTLTAAYAALDTTGTPSAASDGARFVAWVRAPGESRPDPLGAVTVVVDTSRPTAGIPTTPAAVALVAAIAARTPRATVRLVAFDDAPVELAAGPAVEVAPRAQAALAAHGDLGASDLAAALALVAGTDRVIVVGDATATAGADPIVAARAAGLGRIDVLVSTFEHGRRGAGALADAGARPGRVLVATDDTLLAALDVSATGRLRLAVDDALVVWPTIVDSVPPGSPVAFSGRQRVARDLVVRLGEAPSVTLRLTPATAPPLAGLANRIELAAKSAGRGSTARQRIAMDFDGRAIVELVGSDDAIGVPHDMAAVEYIVLGHGGDCRSRDPMADARGDHPATSCFPQGSTNTPNPLHEPLYGVMRAISADDPATALALASAAYLEYPDSAIAIVALGEALEASGATDLASRAYRGLVDQPSPGAAWWRLTAERLDRLGETARPLAIATYREAVRREPGHLGAQRRLALDLVRAGDHAGAIATLREALDRATTDSARALLRDDLAVVLAVARVTAPDAVTATIAATGVQPATAASHRIVLDLEATSIQPMATASRLAGGTAITIIDVALGDGPRVRATSDLPTALAVPDRHAHLWLSVRGCGFAGACAGVAQLIAHDGRGGLTIEDRPFMLGPYARRVDLGVATPTSRRE